jgi:hypothetical protein
VSEGHPPLAPWTSRRRVQLGKARQHPGRTGESTLACAASQAKRAVCSALGDGGSVDDETVLDVRLDGALVRLVHLRGVLRVRMVPQSTQGTHGTAEYWKRAEAASAEGGQRGWWVCRSYGSSAFAPGRPRSSRRRTRCCDGHKTRASPATPNGGAETRRANGADQAERAIFGHI